MRTKLFLFGFFCLLGFSGLWSQTYLTNSSPNTNVPLCNGVPDTASGRFDKQFTTCIGGQTKLYYSFSPASSFQLGSYLILKYQAKNSFATALINTSYKIFGPFNLTDDYSGMIATNSAPILESGNSATGWRSFTSNVLAGKFYIVEITAYSCDGRMYWETQGPDFPCASRPGCESCLPKFQPAGKLFVVSAWVKEETASGNGAVNYTNTELKVTSGTNVYTLTPSGQIIDGWQRIEGIIETNSVGNLKMECIVTSGTSYFDDIRVFPYDGTMVTYVYDPQTLRLVAELDERNYAKIYEYDEEGKLVRVKKETEKGIMTIQENRENTSTNDY